MENASKALIMAATVLLGVMLLTIGVYLFSVYGEYSSNTYAQIEATQIDQFNNQFLKYYGDTTRTYIDNNGREKTETGPILCTAHDIITLANLAKQNNEDQELELADLTITDLDNVGSADMTTAYIQIDIGNSSLTRHLETWNNDEKIQFIQDNSLNGTNIKYYICEEAKVSDITKRVYYMKFEEE